MIRKIILSLCFFVFACAPRSSVASTSTGVADAEFDAAIKQARDSLDMFTTKISTPRASRTFVALKVRFYPPDQLPQEIWIDEVTYRDGVFRGTMGDDIPALKLEMGEKITIDEDDIIDWMVVEDGKLIGGYTIRLAVQRMLPEEREQFLETLDYSIED
jgi:uncharacterized protein YegJ (DUF2314 family)